MTLVEALARYKDSSYRRQQERKKARRCPSIPRIGFESTSYIPAATDTGNCFHEHTGFIFWVLTAVFLKIQAFRDVTLCGLAVTDMSA